MSRNIDGNLILKKDMKRTVYIHKIFILVFLVFLIFSIIKNNTVAKKLPLWQNTGGE